MLLYLVRHGRPDYDTDTLTPEGRLQAEAVGERLSACGISAIYSSPMGRAVETAQPLARRIGLPVQIEPWAEELGEETVTYELTGSRRHLFMGPSAHYHRQDYRGISAADAFDRVAGFRDSGLKQRYEQIGQGMDSLLARHGYERTAEGFYAPVRPNGDSIALFCHCGMTRVLMSYLFHIPFQFLCSTLFASFTGITLVEFSDTEPGPLVPELRTYGDIGHLPIDSLENIALSKTSYTK